jgi:hypothetical protein
MAASSISGDFPAHRAFAFKIRESIAEFDRLLTRAAVIFVAGDGKDLSFNVELGDGIDVAVTFERR